MRLLSPTRLLLPNDDDTVKKFLTFNDYSVLYQIKKLKENIRWKNANPQAFYDYLKQLKQKSINTLLFYDDDSRPYTYSGLWPMLQERFKWKFKPDYPIFDNCPLIPWFNIPPLLYYYQQEALQKMLEFKHCGVELPTGSGKSLIILYLSKELPLKTLIVTPSSAITLQLYQLYTFYFGAKYVGLYGAGKKQFNKLFTIATAQALTKLCPSDEAYQVLSKASVLVFDECHVTPADTFEHVCMDLAQNIPLRFFFSATHLRNDGSEMVLKGITGPIVYKKTFKELVNGGFLAPLKFHFMDVPSKSITHYTDPKMEIRQNFYYNPHVNRLAADLANKSVLLANRQTVILIEEFKQFLQLEPVLKVPFVFVHGNASSEVKQSLPQRYWHCDVQQAVEDFNNNKIKLLIGTSVLGVGVDLKPLQCLIYLQAGSSEVKLRQAIGRGTRCAPNKQDCWVIDFNVLNSPILNRHFKVRKKIYQEFDDTIK